MTISTNTTIKVNGAISAAHTVSANCYAVVNYRVTSTTGINPSAAAGPGPVALYFGPGQLVPASFVNQTSDLTGGSSATYTLFNGVEFINTP